MPARSNFERAPDSDSECQCQWVNAVPVARPGQVCYPARAGDHERQANGARVQQNESRTIGRRNNRALKFEYSNRVAASAAAASSW